MFSGGKGLRRWLTAFFFVGWLLLVTLSNVQELSRVGTGSHGPTGGFPDEDLPVQAAARGTVARSASEHPGASTEETRPGDRSRVPEADAGTAYQRQQHDRRDGSETTQKLAGSAIGPTPGQNQTGQHFNRRSHNPSKKKSELQPKKLPRLTNITFKLPKPVLVASLPKSGTSTSWRYFICGGQSASHLYAKLENGSVERSGKCMMRNVQNNRPLLEGCGRYSVWSDTGHLTRKRFNPECYYPSVHGLSQFYKYYPNASIVLFVRNTDAWAQSAARWSGGSMARQWTKCDNMTKGTSQEDLREFYEWHKQHVRTFARQHPSITYFEVSIEDPMAGQILENYTGIPSMCYANCKPPSNKCYVPGSANSTQT